MRVLITRIRMKIEVFNNGNAYVYPGLWIINQIREKMEGLRKLSTSDLIKQEWEPFPAKWFPFHSLEAIASKQCQTTVILTGSSWINPFGIIRRGTLSIQITGKPVSGILIPISHQAGLGLTILCRLV